MGGGCRLSMLSVHPSISYVLVLAGVYNMHCLLTISCLIYLVERKRSRERSKERSKDRDRSRDRDRDRERDRSRDRDRHRRKCHSGPVSAKSVCDDRFMCILT